MLRAQCVGGGLRVRVRTGAGAERPIADAGICCVRGIFNVLRDRALVAQARIGVGDLADVSATACQADDATL